MCLLLAALACRRADEQPKDAPAPAGSTLSAIPSAAPAPAIPPRPSRPPADANLILITIDCLRADMPWAGYPRPIAPRLTAFEQRSVDFTRAYALSSYTSMSLGGLLAGKLPGELSRDGYFFGNYADGNTFFPEVLQAAGIRTLAAHAHGYFKDSGFKQGFDAYEIVPDLKWNNTTDENVTSPQLEAIAERLLSDPANTGKRFFAWFHFLDPHDQYQPHEGIGPYGKGLRDRYDAEVTFTDQHVGKLLDFVARQPWAERTAIVVSADHGEAFGEHKQYVHGFELWENLVRVPLVVSMPGAPHATVDRPVSAVDLAPTVLDTFGLPPHAGFEGRSLLPEIYGAADASVGEARDVVIDLPATSDNDRRRALVHDRLKAIAYGPTEYLQVYDLAADPGETKPIARGPEFDEMARRYRAMAKTVKDVPATKCKEDCLAGAYARPKDAGAKP